MHILVSINGNPHEWADALVASPDRPRLPIPYAFGGALVRRGIELSCIDYAAPKYDGSAAPQPFAKRFGSAHLLRAMGAVDAAALWGAVGIRAVLQQLRLSAPRRRVLLGTYVWNDGSEGSWRVRRLCLATRAAARFARAVVVMTREQAGLAAATLDGRVPIIRLQCGIDVRFYRTPSSHVDVPIQYRDAVERLLREPYLVMPGDELRQNADALELVSRTGMRLVRVSQYSEKSRTHRLKSDVVDRRLSERVLVFERIDYRFLRFLLQHAAAYVGLVDSSWQPAGWTVACEALASGLPAILYEGLVSRELQALGAERRWMRVAPAGDLAAFQRELETVIASGAASPRDAMISFAGRHLDLEQTGCDFANDLRVALGRLVSGAGHASA